MNDELNPVQEQVIDAMLAETLGGTAPPDVSRQILRRLDNDSPSVGSVAHSHDLGRGVNTAGTVAVASRQSSSSRTQWAVALTVITTLAASLLLAVWLRSDSGSPDLSPSVAATNQPGPSLPEASPGSDIPQIDVPRPDSRDSMAPRRPSRGIPLVMRSADPDRGSSVDDDASQLPSRVSEPAVPSQPPPEALTLVSQEVDAEMQSYWNAVGIAPAAEASAEEISARLKSVLGIELSLDAIADPERLQGELAQQTFARAVATRWLEGITDGGLKRIDAESREALVADLAACFRSDRQERFDVTLAEWINGQNPHASSFYAALSAGPPHASGQTAAMRRLASITMNVDLRCTRCHDSYIEGKDRQHDYWTFAAFLRRGVQRDREGNLEIDPPGSPSSEPVFYETSDGRQRVAEPGIASSWMTSRSGQPISGISQWAQQLVASEELARGVVNSLWQLVHGQPLRSRVIDPISAPSNESLDRLEANLVQDLIGSEFDVARTLTLIIDSPVTRRGVPRVLLPENVLVADESETQNAMNAVNAFAAALPPRAALPMDRRIDQALRSVGATLDASGQPFVAQIGENGKPAASPTAIKTLVADFPRRASSVPAEWLNRIRGEQSQIDHLGYLAGMNRVPSEVRKAAEVTRQVEDRNTALHRVWWLVRP